jgi:hypothetical protein
MRKGIFILIVLILLITQLSAYERMDLLGKKTFIIRISDMSGFLNAIEQSGMGKLWNSEAMKPFLNNQSLGDTLKDTIIHGLCQKKCDNKEYKHLYWEQMKLFKGEVVIGFSYLPNGEIDGSIVAALDKPGFEKTLEYSERLAELDEESGAPKRQDFQGVGIYRSDEKKKNAHTTTWETFYNGTYINANNEEWVKQCVVKLKQELPSSPSCPPTFHVRMSDQFLKDIIEMGAKRQAEREQDNQEEINPTDTTEPTEPPEPTEPSAPAESPKIATSMVTKAMGLDRFKSLSFSVTFKPETMESLFSIEIDLSPGESKGIFALLGTEPLPTGHRLPYVPEDVYYYLVMRLDFNSLWKEIPGIVKTIYPKSAEQFTTYVNMIGAMFQVDLSVDLFGSLGTLTTIYSRMEGLEEQSIFALQLKDAVKIEKILDKFLGKSSLIAANLKDILKVDELNGHKIYTFKTPAAGIPQPDAPQPQQSQLKPRASSSCFCVIDGSLVIGNEKLVRNMIQAASNSKKENRFYQSPAYTSLVRNLPEDTVNFSIRDFSQYLKPMLEMLKNIYSRTALPGRSPQEPDKSSPFDTFLRNLRFDLLPSMEFMTPYLGTSISYGQYKNGTFTIRETAVYPPKKN